MTKTNYLSLIASSIVILMSTFSIVVGGGCDRYYYYFNVLVLVGSLMNILRTLLIDKSK